MTFSFFRTSPLGPTPTSRCRSKANGGKWRRPTLWILIRCLPQVRSQKRLPWWEHFRAR